MVLDGQLAHSITFGTTKNPCCASGALASTVVADIAVGDDVIAQPELLIDHGGQRLDPVGIHLAKLLDPAEDLVELGHEPFELLVAHGDARELRDVPDLVGSD